VRVAAAIDISKESLNWAVCSANKIILEQVSGNDIKSITKTVLSIQQELKFKIPCAVFCMEHTARTPLSTVLQRTSGVLNRSPRGAPHESYSAEGNKASPLALACSQFERTPRGAFQVMNFLEFLHRTNLKADAVA